MRHSALLTFVFASLVSLACTRTSVPTGDGDADPNQGTTTNPGQTIPNQFDPLGSAGSTSAANSNIYALAPVDADNNSRATIIIELKDDNDNPVVGVVPEYTASGSQNDIILKRIGLYSVSSRL